MIRKATNKDIDGLKELWKLCFTNDDQDDIDLFFDNRFSTANGLVYSQGKQIVSMMFRLPCKFQGENAWYLYALATHPDFRGLGYMAQLIEYSHAQMEKENIEYCLLLEGESSLCEYYKRFGYQSAFCYRLAKLSGQSDMSVLYADVEYVESIRSKKLVNAVQWDIEALSYANKYSKSINEQWFRVDDGYAIASKTDGKVYISELVCTDMIRAAQSVNTYYSVNECIVKLPPNMTIGDKIYRGMIYAPNGQTIKDAYISMELE